jgi:lipopolysaccharide export system permease protein
LSAAPSCIRFSRQFSPFPVYAICLFCLIGLYISIDAAHVLAKRQLVDPLLAMSFPLMFAFALSTWRYCKN